MQPLIHAANLAGAENAWFTPEHIERALNSLGELLRPEHLSTWIEPYRKYIPPLQKTIGVVMAGNIPAVGFHDMLCVLVAGFRLNAKLASGDAQLIPAMAGLLESFDSGWKGLINFTSNRLESFDAIIATGSNNSSRYFDFYFSRYPNIIRHNRSSVAILSGSETSLELQRLADDIFLYFGLGCRNISKIFVPEGYDFGRLPEAFKKYNHFCNHNKYRNNYDYMKSIYLINKIPFLDTGTLLITESQAFTSSIGVLFFEQYQRIEEVTSRLVTRKNEVQCVVSTTDPGIPYVQPGRAQEPSLWDYADDVDTMNFLLHGIS